MSKEINEREFWLLDGLSIERLKIFEDHVKKRIREIGEKEYEKKYAPFGAHIFRPVANRIFNILRETMNAHQRKMSREEFYDPRDDEMMSEVYPDG